MNASLNEPPMNRRGYIFLRSGLVCAVSSVALALAACGGGGTGSGTPLLPAPTATPAIATAAPSASPSPSNIASPAVSAAPTVAPTSTSTAAPTSTPVGPAATPTPLGAAFVGNWTGTFTQSNPAGSYTAAMSLQQSASGPGGTFSIDNGNGEKETFNISDSIVANVFTFNETSVVSQTTLSSTEYWCNPIGATLTLSADGNMLSGPWSSAGCNSGTMQLKKVSS